MIRFTAILNPLPIYTRAIQATRFNVTMRGRTDIDIPVEVEHPYTSPAIIIIDGPEEVQSVPIVPVLVFADVVVRT